MRDASLCSWPPSGTDFVLLAALRQALSSVETTSHAEDLLQRWLSGRRAMAALRVRRWRRRARVSLINALAAPPRSTTSSLGSLAVTRVIPRVAKNRTAALAADARARLRSLPTPEHGCARCRRPNTAEGSDALDPCIEMPAMPAAASLAAATAAASLAAGLAARDAYTCPLY
jgi:hypothetical protein